MRLKKEWVWFSILLAAVVGAYAVHVALGGPLKSGMEHWGGFITSPPILIDGGFHRPYIIREGVSAEPGPFPIGDSFPAHLSFSIWRARVVGGEWFSNWIPGETAYLALVPSSPQIRVLGDTVIPIRLNTIETRPILDGADLATYYQRFDTTVWVVVDSRPVDGALGTWIYQSRDDAMSHSYLAMHAIDRGPFLRILIQ